jgi:hypothetical protein
MSHTRRLLRLAVAVALARGIVGTAGAHGGAVAADGHLVGLTAVVALTVGVAVVAGLAAAVRGQRVGGRWLTALVGPLLVVLGGTAALSAAETDVVVAGGCLAAGAVLAWAMVRHAGDGDVHETCANTTLGAVTAHRAVEGVALAVVYATGSAVGLLGAAVLAGHATVETAAVGCLFGVTSRSRAALAVGVVQVGFLAGTAAGIAAIAGVPSTVGTGTLALVGGVLFVVGGVEMARHSSRSPG